MSAPRPDLPGLVNGPVLLVAALLASPAFVLLARGLLSPTEVLTRYLIITGGCIALWGLARLGLRAVIASPPPPTSRPEAAAAISGVVVDRDGTRVVDPEPIDPESLDLPPEQLIPLSLRKAQPDAG